MPGSRFAVAHDRFYKISTNRARLLRSAPVEQRAEQCAQMPDQRSDQCVGVARHFGGTGCGTTALP
jgi:hypothetical protein